MAVEQTWPAGLEGAVERARERAAKTGELHPGVLSTMSPAVPDELAEFVSVILSDGTYTDAIESIGRQDPDIATG